MAVALNAFFVVTEIYFGFVSKSVALIADAVHNFSDIVGLLLAWGGLWLAKLAPTLRRTYGYQSASYIAALANAALLMMATGAIVLESLRRFAEPAPIEAKTVIIVALIGIAINGGTAMLFWRGQKHDLNIRGAFLHMAADAALSLGVVISALMILFTGWLWVDPVVSLLIAAFIFISTMSFAREALNMTLAAVPAHIDPIVVRDFLAGQAGVLAVHDLHIWPLSTTETALTVHLVAPGRRTDEGFLNTLCAELKARFKIHHPTIQLEGSMDAAICTLATHTPNAA